jgi:hypothetical protein
MQALDEESEPQNEAAEETEPQVEEQQAPEPPKSLGVAKQELSAALKNHRAQIAEVDQTEKRLADANQEEENLLDASELSEEDQVERLSRAGARKRVLDRKLEHGRAGLQGAEAELEHACQEALRSFEIELADLRQKRHERNLAALKKLVPEEKWPWAQQHAISFVQFTADLAALNFLGYRARQLVEGGSVQEATKQLLKDIGALEAEKKAGKR